MEETFNLLLKLWPILLGLVAVTAYVVTLKIEISVIQKSRDEFRTDYYKEKEKLELEDSKLEERIVELEKWQREANTKMEAMKETIGNNMERTASHFVLLKEQVIEFSAAITKRVDDAIKDIRR